VKAVARAPREIRRRGRACPAAAPRRAVAWLALAGLVFQLFVTQLHSFMGPLGWSEPPPAAAGDAAYAQALASQALCLAPSQAAAGAAAKNTTDGSHSKPQDCPIYHSLPLVSASLLSQTIELPAPPRRDHVAWVAWVDRAARGALHLRPQPRAPPLPA
jgi:hypothetical protein